MALNIYVCVKFSMQQIASYTLTVLSPTLLRDSKSRAPIEGIHL